MNKLKKFLRCSIDLSQIGMAGIMICMGISLMKYWHDELEFDIKN